LIAGNQALVHCSLPLYDKNQTNKENINTVQQRLPLPAIFEIRNDNLVGQFDTRLNKNKTRTSYSKNNHKME